MRSKASQLPKQHQLGLVLATIGLGLVVVACADSNRDESTPVPLEEEISEAPDSTAEAPSDSGSVAAEAQAAAVLCARTPDTPVLLSAASWTDFESATAPLREHAPAGLRDAVAALSAYPDAPLAVTLVHPATFIRNRELQSPRTPAATEEIDAWATSNCGKPWFGGALDGVLAVDGDPKPVIRGTARSFDTWRFLGQTICDRGADSATGANLYVVSCDGAELHAIDITTTAMVWSTSDLPGAVVGRPSAASGVVAIVTEELSEAVGLTAREWSSWLTILDATSGAVRSQVRLHDLLVSPEGNRVDLVDVQFGSPTATNYGMVITGFASGFAGPSAALGFDTAGDLRYVQQNTHSDVGYSVDRWFPYVALADDGQQAVHDVRSGELLGRYDGQSFGPPHDPCTTRIVVGIDSENFGPTVGDGDMYTARVLSLPDMSITAIPIGDPASVPGVNAFTRVEVTQALEDGLIVEGSEAATGARRVWWVDNSGEIGWVLGDDVVDQVIFIAGNLIVVNQSGQYIRVDPRTGADLGPWDLGEDTPTRFDIVDHDWFWGRSGLTPWGEQQCSSVEPVAPGSSAPDTSPAEETGSISDAVAEAFLDELARVAASGDSLDLEFIPELFRSGPTSEIVRGSLQSLGELQGPCQNYSDGSALCVVEMRQNQALYGETNRFCLVPFDTGPSGLRWTMDDGCDQ